MINNQIVGNQSAPVTLGFSRMSRRNRKTINPTVRSAANLGGIWQCQRAEDRRQKTEDGP
jgi:hypothetical protein